MAASDGPEHNPSSPAGQIESVGDFASGLTHLSGWRRQVARWLVIAVIAAPVIAIVVVHLVR